jgi:hypothetical protein
MNLNPIEKRIGLTREVFIEEYLKPKRPVVGLRKSNRL